jgi:seryl-tRNA synthetase
MEKKIFYISESIKDFNLLISDNQIDGIEYRLNDRDSEPEAIERKIQFAIDKQFTNRVSLPTDRIWHNEKQRQYHGDMFELLRAKGEAVEMAEGLVGVGETFITLFDYFDMEIKNLVKNKFNAAEYRYPTLIPAPVMRKSGYLNFFPQFIMFATRLHSDFDAYQEFMEKSKSPEPFDYRKYCSEIEYCLPPTMCYHTYHQLSNSMRPLEPGTVITARGKSFRFESKYYKNLERLWDFTIREIVFIGSHDFVITSRKRLMAEVFALLDQWDMVGYCETANDPFFFEDQKTDSRISQRVMKLKYELQLNIDENNTIACSSFNLHNDFIARSFNIRFEDDTHVRTGCAGFGLERLVFAFLCQYGLEPGGWPSRINQYLSKKKEIEGQP